MTHVSPIVPGLQYAVTSDERTMGLLSHLLGLFFGFLGPLIIFVTRGRESAFVHHQSAEALNFHITLAIAYVICIPLCFVLVGFLLLPAVAIIHLVYGIIASVNANHGIAYRYPINIRMVT